MISTDLNTSLLLFFLAFLRDQRQEQNFQQVGGCVYRELCSTSKTPNSRGSCKMISLYIIITYYFFLCYSFMLQEFIKWLTQKNL